MLLGITILLIFAVSFVSDLASDWYLIRQRRKARKEIRDENS